MAALLYLVIGNEQTMAVFPNYYQMAVQFTVDPPIAEELVENPQTTIQHSSKYETPGASCVVGKRRRA